MIEIICQKRSGYFTLEGKCKSLRKQNFRAAHSLKLRLHIAKNTISEAKPCIFEAYFIIHSIFPIYLLFTMSETVQDLLAGRNKDPFAQKLVNFGNSRLVALHPLNVPNVRYSLPWSCYKICNKFTII
jgi:hypothetical protein